MPVDPHSYGLFFSGGATESTLLPIIDPTADLGKFVNGILLNPEKTIGHRFNVAEKLYTLGQITQILQQQGLRVNLHPIDMQTFKAGLAAKGLPESFQTTMQHVVEYIVEYGYFHGEDIDQALEVSVSEPLLSLSHMPIADWYITNSSSLNPSHPLEILPRQIPHSIIFWNSSSIACVRIYWDECKVSSCTYGFGTRPRRSTWDDID